MPWKDTRPSARDPEAARFKTPLDPALLARLADAHCHPSDDEAFDGDVLRGVKTGTIQAMSSSLENQTKTVDVYRSSPHNVVPYFGLHPWFSHPITFAPLDALPSKEEHYSSLFPDPTDPSSPHPQLSTVLETFPDPVPISTFLASLEKNLLSHPNSNVGEIGLDKAFKIPQPPHISADKSNPKHTDLATPFAHQVKVLEAQLDVAIRLGRNISFHSVRAPQETVEVLKRFKAEKKGLEKIHICLHSFGGRPESAVQIQKAHHNVFFSFATIISGRSPKFHDLLRAIEPHRLLVESDFTETGSIDDQIWECLEEIQEARSWSLEETVSQLEQNFKRFTTPLDERPPPPLSNKQKKLERKRADLYISEEEEEGEKGK